MLRSIWIFFYIWCRSIHSSICRLICVSILCTKLTLSSYHRSICCILICIWLKINMRITLIWYGADRWVIHRSICCVLICILIYIWRRSIWIWYESDRYMQHTQINLHIDTHIINWSRSVLTMMANVELWWVGVVCCCVFCLGGGYSWNIVSFELGLISQCSTHFQREFSLATNVCEFCQSILRISLLLMLELILSSLRQIFSDLLTSI